MTRAPDDPINKALAAYKSAVHAKDRDAFVALYDEQVRVFDMWGTWQYRGLGAWGEMAAGWFGSLDGERVVVDFDEVETTLTSELAIGHAFVTYTAVDAEGGALRSLDNRLTIVMRRVGSTWKIVHEHSSGPIDHESAKVMLQR